MSKSKQAKFNISWADNPDVFSRPEHNLHFTEKNNKTNGHGQSN